MEIFAIIASVFAALVLLDLTAVSAGCDSRETFPDDHTR
jgi:hypothetical protein